MKRRRVGSLVGLVALAPLLSGCGPVSLIAGLLPGPASPAQAAQQSLSGGMGPAVPGTFKVLGTRAGAGGVAVFYAVRRPAWGRTPAMQWYGVAMTRRMGLHWVSSGGGETGRPQTTALGELVDHDSLSGSSSENGPYTAVYGSVLPAGKRAGVSTVDVSLATGQTVRDTVSGGVFGIVVAQATTACSLQVRDTRGRVLRRYDLVGPSVPAKGYYVPRGCHG